MEVQKGLHREHDMTSKQVWKSTAFIFILCSVILAVALLTGGKQPLAFYISDLTKGALQWISSVKWF